MLLRYTSNERRLRALVYTIIAVALLSAVFGLLRQMTQREVGFVLPHLRPGLGYGQFINKNHFAFLMEMALGLVLGLVVTRGVERDLRLIYLGVALLLGGALVSSNSRGGILSLLCQLVFAAWLFFTVRPVRDSAEPGSKILRRVQHAGSSLLVRALLIGCLIAVIGVGIIWVGGDPLVGNLEAISTEVGAPPPQANRWGVRRLDIWPATWRLIKDHPVSGVGFGGYWMAIPAYHDASGEMTPQEAHNDYLEFLASGGLIGVALGGWFIYVFIRNVRPRLRAPDKFRRAASFGALVGLSGIAVHSVVDFGLHITVNALVFIALLVIATADVSFRPPESVTT
jgi:O-antigen ligase